MDLYDISEAYLSKSEYICFELFEVWALKKETLKNIHDLNVAELVHYIIHTKTEVFYFFMLLNGMARKGYINFP